jgi:cation transport ATPase
MDRIERQGPHRTVMQEGNGRLHGDQLDDVSIGELLKQLSTDASLLVRQEVSLAKAEAKESIKQLKQMTVRLALAAALALPGLIAITAFLVIALGEAINSYWASALIIGAALLGTSWILVRRALAVIADGKLGMPGTATALGDNVEWGKDELRAFKRELTA